MRVAFTLTPVLAMLMAVQAALGLLFEAQYRDSEWIRATWFGNDWITLLLAVPLLLGSLASAAAESVRGLLLWLGLLGYAVYNYAFYLLGASLNAFFPLYVLLVLVAVVTLVIVLSHLDAGAVARRFRPTTPARIVGGYLVFVAAGLTVVWGVLWATYVFAGHTLAADPEAFKIVAALDLTMMVPALATGGILLWRRAAWGYVIAALASIQGALYLLVLTVNSLVAIARDLVAPPGELPMWSALSVCTTIAAAALLRHVEGGDGRLWRTPAA